MDWYPWYSSIFKADTMDLDPFQDGCYRRLIDYYMETRAPIPSSDTALARIIGIGVDEWKEKAADSVRAFFVEKGDKLVHDFCDNELDEQDSKRKRKSKAGKKGAKKRWSQDIENNEENASAIAAARLLHGTGQERTGLSNDKPPLPPIEKTDFKMPDGTLLNLDQFFERLWQLYPKIRDKGHKGKAKEQLKLKIKKGISYEIIGRGVARYRRYCDATDERNSDFVRWLRDDRWESDFAIPADKKTNNGRGAGYSINAVYEQAMGDQTNRQGGREERLKGLGIEPD